MSRSLAATIVAFVVTLAAGDWAVAQVPAPAGARARPEKEVQPVPVPVGGGAARLTPDNTMIQFVGTHTGERPDPRTGYFTKFTGELLIDEASAVLRSVEVHIETASLITPIGRLTNHLRSPDFFDVRRYPEAQFRSTKIEPIDAAAGQFKITGDLTIRDVTRTLTFPVTVRLTDAGAVVTSRFTIKRTDFGMTFGPDRVVDDVTLTVVAGRKTPHVEGQ